MNSPNPKGLLSKIKSGVKGSLSNISTKISGKANGKSWQIQTYLDKKLVYSLSKSRTPSFKQLKYIKKFLSPKELLIIRTCILVIIASLLFSGFRFYKTHLQTIPVKGGEYSEGLIGSPKHINPLYSSLADVDSDLASLIFSSLFKRDGNGELTKDLAQDYSISADNRMYTVKIRDNVSWHNGNRLTVDDVIFTFNAIKDSAYNSSLRSSFSGVEIQKADDQSVRFILREPYAAFLELLIFGIIPADLWNQTPPDSANLAELNLTPIGSGPYKFGKYTKDKATGAIVDYSLVPFDNYYKQSALINLKFKFFPNFEEAVIALDSKQIDGLSYLPKELEKNISITNSYNFDKLHIPQLTLIYFNARNNSALGSKQLRQALALAIDRNEIINSILGGEAYLVDSPILPNNFAYSSDVKKYEFSSAEAAKILDNLGWKQVEIKAADLEASKAKIEDKDKSVKAQAEKILVLGEGKWRQKDKDYLIIRIATVDRAENQEVVQSIKKYWENIGIKTEIDVYPAVDIQRNIIKTRSFEALFYGLVTGADPDPYAFWHSSQVGENGFNIADFVNKEADRLLEDGRLVSDQAKRQEIYKNFQKIISDEIPVIFMYSPTYTYVQDKKIKDFKVTNIVYPSDRFSNVCQWYIQTGRKIIW